jgi:hypothetical protein
MSFAAGFLLLTWVVASILVNGVALLHRLTKLRGLELVGYGAAAGVLLHAVLGWAIAALPMARWGIAGLLLALTLLSAVYLLVRRLPHEFSLALSRPSKISLALWGLFLVLNLGLLHLDVRFPESLPEGLYVFTTHTTNVKVQYLTSLPADNYIPFAVTEFIVRGVSFKKVRPIMPSNEVSNRTILMSLVAVPFQVVLGAPRDRPQLGAFFYVGQLWWDVSQLNTDGYFEQFAVVGLVLNSLLLLGLFVFCSSLGANSILPLGAVLYITNPYFIAQTVYTWPKAMAGFFILLAWTSIRSGHGPAVVAALLALACHSHPYAIVFAGCTALFYLTQWRREKRRVPSALLYLLVVLLILAPWIIWTRFMLRIPSDLVGQNFAGPETATAWASPLSFVWIRFQNFFSLLGSALFTVRPFDFEVVLIHWLSCLPGVVGLVMLYPALAQCGQLSGPRSWLWYGLFGPALLILAIYSCPAVPVLHGYQTALGVLLFFGVWWLTQHCSRTVCAGLVGLQLLFNLSLVLSRGLITGAHFW